MSHHDPEARSESLEDTFEDVVPTQRRPKGVGETARLTPPPARVKPGEDRHVDLKAILSEPPRLTDQSVDPWPALPAPPRLPNLKDPALVSQRYSVHQSDSWSQDTTPPPLSSELGSMTPTALTNPPQGERAPSRNAGVAWKVATGGLAAALAVAVALVFVPADGREANAPAAAAGMAEEPPVVSVEDLPVVGLVEEPAAMDDAITAGEVAIVSEISEGVADESQPARPAERREAREQEPARSESEAAAALPAERERSEEPAAEAEAEQTESAAAPEQEVDKAEAEGAPAEPEPPKSLAPFDPGAASSAMQAAAANAASCREPGTPAGTVRVSVTFAPTGRATTALVSGAFAGTSVGGCIARTFRAARVEPFEGNLVTVHKTVTIR